MVIFRTLIENDTAGPLFLEALIENSAAAILGPFFKGRSLTVLVTSILSTIELSLVLNTHVSRQTNEEAKPRGAAPE